MEGSDRSRIGNTHRLSNQWNATALNAGLSDAATHEAVVEDVVCSRADISSLTLGIMQFVSLLK